MRDRCDPRRASCGHMRGRNEEERTRLRLRLSEDLIFFLSASTLPLQLGSQRKIDRLAFPFEQQENRLILRKAGSGLFIGLKRAHYFAIDFEYKIAFAYTHFLRRASGLDPDHNDATIGGLQSIPRSQFLV